MGSAHFYFQHPWLVALAICAGLFYAWLLYGPKQEWSTVFKYSVFSIRFLVVFIIVLLLAGPISRFFERRIEKPEMIIALDNSLSIKAFNDTNAVQVLYAKLNTLKEQLEEKGVQVNVLDFQQQPSTLALPSTWIKQSPLSVVLAETQDLEEHKNFRALLLVTDGIYNKGINPLYQAFNTPIYSIGLGDTIPQKDIKVKKLLYNKISYKGNLFPVHADIAFDGLKGKTVTVSLKHKQNTLATQQLTLNKDKGSERISFQATGKEKGLLHLRVEVSVVEGEKNTVNNTAHAYIEIIDTKEKILICAAAAHPDIKAIRTALEKKENTETILFIPGIHTLPAEKFDLIVFHQLPHVQGLAQNEFNRLLTTETPKLFIVGNQTNLSALSQSNALLSISPRSNQKDLAGAALNANFSKFNFPDDQTERWNETPPLQVPFGDYKVKQEADIIFHQRIGRVSTNTPLLISSTDRKTAVLCGEGIWWWRLQEYSKYGEAEAFDKLINDLVQYLSSKEDKRKFKVYPTSNEFTAGEAVIFQAEIYNDIYEPLYNTPFEVSLRSENDEVLNYKFVHQENTNGYAIKGIKPGVYQYQASAVLNGKKEVVQGEFLVSEEIQELMESTADHRLLRELSAQTKGKFYTPQQTDELSKVLLSQEHPDILHATEGLMHWIQWTWIMWLLILLASAEWALRKNKGVY
jgi:hypothetical protein